MTTISKDMSDNETDELMLMDDDDDLLLLADDDFLGGDQDDENFTDLTARTAIWKVLIVDDEPEVHHVTQLALEEFNFHNKPIAFISAYSGAEAKQLIEEHPDTAIMLLDVVMEDNHAGLDVAKYIREVLNNNQVRIILRTGQPGEAPEEAVIVNYDINDYKLKMDLSQRRLFTTIVSALRSYEDIITIQSKQEELQAQKVELIRVNKRLAEEIERSKQLEQIRFEQERLRLEKEFLEKQTRELEKLNEDKDKFFSIVAHDLKGPFTPLLGNAELLMEMAEILPPKEIKEMSASIYRSTHHVSNLLKNLLEWARMQMGRMEFQPTKVDIHDLVDKNLTLLAGNAAQKKIKVENLVEIDLYGYADQYMIDTVVRNLVSNALKFTPSNGKGTVKVSATRVDKEPGTEANYSSWVEVMVTDNGVGIPPENLQKLFKIGVHHTTLGTQKEAGTGLGLIMCQDMVERNGGQLTADSEVGKGSTFKFIIPAYINGD